ncbi:MAG: helix-turn-helix domain-containing protein [Zoogloeaceae bacterium]|jgi:hypothetical protein|nr:helix-turn-helix domain-containing protein [Zoogloeaceae bacterium]
MTKYSKVFLDLCASITDKRPRTVIEHILKHGQITTDELKTLYGYNHPPRAARDARERGVPLKTIRVTGPDGRKIAAYCFEDMGNIRFRCFDGRTGLSKAIKDKLVAQYGCRCFIYLEEMEYRDLQIDHRIPYEIAGEADELHVEDFMLLCASANRAKSWSCEHCENWKTAKDRTLCLTCYWAFPESCRHVVMRQVRRLDLIWQGAEISAYEHLKENAQSAGKNMPDFVKEILAKVVNL